MDFVPTQDVAYEPHDELTFVCHPEQYVRLVYEDWLGNQQERTIGRGTWPIKTTKLLGFRSVESGATPTWGPRQDLSELSVWLELSVGKSASQELPRQMRRAR